VSQPPQITGDKLPQTHARGVAGFPNILPPSKLGIRTENNPWPKICEGLNLRDL
jgi:hypothetical protein